MTKIVAAIFPDEAKAHEGNLALKKLGAEGIAVYASALVSKNSDNRLTVLEHACAESHVTASLL